MGQAISVILTPLMAGALYGLVGLNGIILIDAVTYFFAIGALLLVRIPQPKRLTAKNPVARKHLSGKKPLLAGSICGLCLAYLACCFILPASSYF